MKVGTNLSPYLGNYNISLIQQCFRIHKAIKSDSPLNQLKTLMHRLNEFFHYYAIRYTHNTGDKDQITEIKH